MKGIATRLVSLVTLVSLLFSLTACKKDDTPSPEAHVCSYTWEIADFPTFNYDGKKIGYCSCGQAVEQVMEWENSVLYDTANSALSEFRWLTEEERILYNEKRRAYESNVAYFDSLEEMFLYDRSLGDLESVTNGEYTIFINKYTGTTYYQNNVTGQLTANAGMNIYGHVIRNSGINVSFYDFESGCSEGRGYYLDSTRERLKISKTDNSIKAKYFIGGVELRAMLPLAVEAHEFENAFLRPMMDNLYKELVEKLGEEYALDFFGGCRKTVTRTGSDLKIEETDEPYYNAEEIYSDRYLHDYALQMFEEDLSDILSLLRQQNSESEEVRQTVQEIDKLYFEIRMFFSAYYPLNSQHEKFVYNEEFMPAAAAEGVQMYVVKNTNHYQTLYKAEILKKHVPDYTFNKMFVHEAMCGYVHENEPTMALIVEIEYVLNDDGSFSINLIDESTVYDTVHFSLVKLTTNYLLNANVGFEIGTGEHIFLPPGPSNEA